jgi:hypothetical protein
MKISLSTNSQRLNAIRESRNVPELMRIITAIGKETKQIIQGACNGSIVVAAANDTDGKGKKKGPVTEVITIDHTGTVDPNSSTDKPSATVKNFKMPNKASLGTLSKEFAVIQKLYNNALDLDSVESMLLHSFVGSKNQPAALKAVRALKAEIDEKVSDSFTHLASVASKHLPPEIQRFANKIKEYILENVKVKSYSEMFEEVYAIPAKQSPDDLEFCYYFTLKDLTNEHGYSFGEYNVVLTALVNPGGGVKYFINAIPDFKIPGSYPMGKQVKSGAEALLRLKLLLAHNNVVTEHEKEPMPIDTDRAKTSGLTNIPDVKDASVKDDTLILKIAKTGPDTVNSILTKVIPLLKKVLGLGDNSKVVIQSRLIKPKKELHIVLTPNLPNRTADKQTKLNVKKLDELRDLLDLSDVEVQAIKLALKSQ